MSIFGSDVGRNFSTRCYGHFLVFGRGGRAHSNDENQGRDGVQNPSHAVSPLIPACYIFACAAYPRGDLTVSEGNGKRRTASPGLTKRHFSPRYRENPRVKKQIDYLPTTFATALQSSLPKPAALAFW